MHMCTTCAHAVYACIRSAGISTKILLVNYKPNAPQDHIHTDLHVCMLPVTYMPLSRSTVDADWANYSTHFKVILNVCLVIAAYIQLKKE